MLARIRVPITIRSFDDCVPSLWVAIIEGLLEARIPGVVRMPSGPDGAATTVDKLQNAQAVVWVLEQQIIKAELPHIKAEDIVERDSQTLLDLTGLIWEISQAIDGAGSQASQQQQQQQQLSPLNNHSIASASEISPISLRGVVTPPILRIAPGDTPHTQALKIRRAALLRHERSKNETQSLLKTLKTWTYALDDRLWTQKVVMQKELSNIQDDTPLEYVRKEAMRTHLVNLRKSQSLERHRAKTNLNNEIRRVKRMENRQRQIESDVHRVAEQRRVKEEMMVKGLLDQYVRVQRAAILEERRFERDIRNAEDQKRKTKETSRRNLYPFLSSCIVAIAVIVAIGYDYACCD
eukprot:jgi/Hompol1/2804/HPOL_003028-RA